MPHLIPQLIRQLYTGANFFLTPNITKQNHSISTNSLRPIAISRLPVFHRLVFQVHSCCLLLELCSLVVHQKPRKDQLKPFWHFIISFSELASCLCWRLVARSDSTIYWLWGDISFWTSSNQIFHKSSVFTNLIVPSNFKVQKDVSASKVKRFGRINFRELSIKKN